MTAWLMTEAPLALIGGLLGSSHCLGMCGPLALLVGGGRSWRSNLLRQFAYTCGRVFTYASLGAAAGFLGMRLSGAFGGGLRAAPIALSLLAGALLVRQGLLSLGLARPSSAGAGGACLIGGPALSGLLRDGRLGGVFLAGLLTGFLPCGLVYGFLALAAASSFWLSGAVLMAAFGLGTAPLMIAAGTAAGLLQGAAQARVLRLAAWSVVIAGSAAIVRGAVFGAALWNAAPADTCPFCDPTEATRPVTGEEGSLTDGSRPQNL